MLSHFNTMLFPFKIFQYKIKGKKSKNNSLLSVKIRNLLFYFLVQMYLCLPTHRCQEEFQLRSSQSYIRSRVLEVEQGICQHCGLHAHELFLKVRNVPPFQRKEMLESTWLAQLSVKQVRSKCLDNRCFSENQICLGFFSLKLNKVQL